MKPFQQDIQRIITLMNNGTLAGEDLLEGIKLSGNTVADFHFYSLGLKYYSYLERNRDVEDHIDESEEIHHDGHDHDHDHDHDHGHQCEHDHGIKSREVEDMQIEFSKMFEGMKKEHQLPTVNEIMDLRNRLEAYVKVLTAYGDQINILENVYYKSRYTAENMVAMDSDEAFAKRVTEFLMAIENNIEIREHMKYIYPELPMRMHRNKFFGFFDEYVKRLQGIPFEDVKNHLEMIKETFNPALVEQYGKIVPEIAEEIDKAKSVLVDGSAGEKDSAYHHLYHLTEDKNNLLEACLDMAEILNHLLGIVVCQLTHFEENVVYKKMEHLLDLEADDGTLSDVFEDVENNYEPLGQELMLVNQFVEKLIESEYINLLEDELIYKELEFAMVLTREGYFIERPSVRDEYIPSYKELAVLKSDLLNVMEETFANDSRVLRRSRMSMMMGILQAVHTSGQEIYDHIYESVASCQVASEKVMAMQNIYLYISELTD